ncbi:MAG: hypothetical protein ACXWAV_06330 [Chthoniobacterales bacterium]
MDDWNPFEQAPAVETVRVFGIDLKRGDRVRLWPQKTADILDLALAGKIAEIEAIELDYDNQVHLAVVLEDDTGRDLGTLRQPGHRFFFSPEEVEPLALDRASTEAGS